ncbi:hypothetical protein EXU48_12495 [Occultella glacieicola]|uniref:Heme exporter protein D n=1 Tax=Occultella glacieicola TaxID=2518684 RepID=A0ABY2E8N3_9MICO|nr:hypothetical protein EXU48_12495 [Occultella glacieicola]
MSGLWDSLAALAPSVGVAFLFIVAIRAMVHADRRERIARARVEAEEDARTDRESRDGKM